MALLSICQQIKLISKHGIEILIDDSVAPIKADNERLLALSSSEILPTVNRRSHPVVAGAIQAVTSAN